MKHIKLFEDFNKINETIFPEEFDRYKDENCQFSYHNLNDFTNAMYEYDGSFEPKDKPWGDLICLGEKKYLLTEYGNSGEKDYMIFTNINDEDSYFTVYYNPVTSNAGKRTKPFTFYHIEDNI